MVTMSRLEKQRLAALKRLHILDTAPDSKLDRLTRLARQVLNTDIALISILDERRQWFKSATGTELKETPRDIAFCDEAIKQDGPYLVENALENELFKDNPLVTGPLHLRFYAGIPIREPSGFKIGTLCVLHSEPKKITEHELAILKTLASLVEDEIKTYETVDRVRQELEISRADQAISRVQNLFMTTDDIGIVFDQVLKELLELTNSPYGFLSEVLVDPTTNTPFLKIGAITNLAWNESPGALSTAITRDGMYFRRLDTLIGTAIVDESVVISNDVKNDSRNHQFPHGHPTLHKYIGIPIHSGNRLVGLVGLANRDKDYDEGLIEELSTLFNTIGNLLERLKLLRQQAEYQQKLEHSANYDQLTGLPNRRRLKDMFSQSMSVGERFALCFIDLDGFKEINDKHGHDIGDLVLKSIAERLNAGTRNRDCVARFGGDEFVVVVRDCADKAVFTRILNSLQNPVRIKNLSLSVTASMGITYYPDDLSDWDQLIRHADHAMYVAKQAGKNGYCFFDLQKHSTSADNLQIQTDLARGLEARELELYLQPKVNMQQNMVEGFEGLIRWNHPERGLVGPDAFINQVESSELAKTLGRYVLTEAVSILNEFKSAGFGYSLSINLSPSHFLSDSFTFDVLNSLKNGQHGIATKLIFEILETTALDDIQTVIKRLTFCRGLGIEVALDDFGVGYSSLEYFRRLPVHEIKIDRSFIKDMQLPDADQRIAVAIIRLAESFDRRVVAEGIEDLETYQRLKQLGCNIGQGYYLSHPLPQAKALHWVSQSTWNPRLSE